MKNSSRINKVNRERRNAERPCRRMVRSRNLFLVILLVGHSSLFGALGDSEEQCTKRYGAGEVTYYQAETHYKVISYSHLFSEDIEVTFKNGLAVHVNYLGNLSEEKVAKYLELNAQGHKWSLVSQTGSGLEHESWRTYKRDDGATAEWSNGLSSPRFSFSPPPLPTQSPWWKVW